MEKFSNGAIALHKKNASLAAEYGITEETLALRRQFIRLGEDDRQRLIGLIPWAQGAGPLIAGEFYDWQFGFPGTRAFFEEYAAKKGMALEALRSHLEKAQSGYFISIFTGARERWGLHYFENRLMVGKVHDQINLPFKWYIGAYAEYQRLVRQHLRPSNNGVRSWWTKRSNASTPDWEKSAEAISKVFNYDMQAIGDSFLLSTLESMGLDVSSVQSDRGRTKQNTSNKSKTWSARCSNKPSA